MICICITPTAPIFSDDRQSQKDLLLQNQFGTPLQFQIQEVIVLNELVFRFFFFYHFFFQIVKCKSYKNSIQSQEQAGIFFQTMCKMKLWMRIHLN